MNTTQALRISGVVRHAVVAYTELLTVCYCYVRRFKAEEAPYIPYSVPFSRSESSEPMLACLTAVSDR
jgi:hypothetical protein